jgi:hypothetical protein
MIQPERLSTIPTAAPPCEVRPADGRAFAWTRRGWPHYVAGRTVVATLQHDDSELSARMAPNTRREVRKAGKAFRVRRATRADAMEWELLADMGALEHGKVPGHRGACAEWFAPDRLLLVAVDDLGLVVAGSGFSVCRGGWLDYRANASDWRFRRSGVNALLAYEAMRYGRGLGCVAVNWCGATPFKRHLGGVVVPVYGRGFGLRAFLRRAALRLHQR